MSIWRPDIDELVSQNGNYSQMFRWTVQFATIPNVLSSNYSVQDLTNDVNFRAESMSLPEASVESTEIQIRGQKVHQAGIVTYNSPLTLTVMETIDNKMLSFIGHWQEASWESNYGRGRTAYKKDLVCEMNLYLLDNTDRPYYVFHLHYCQPENVGKGDLDAGSADPLKPAISIAYDYFTKDPISRSGSFVTGRNSTDVYTKNSYFSSANPF